MEKIMVQLDSKERMMEKITDLTKQIIKFKINEEIRIKFQNAKKLNA